MVQPMSDVVRTGDEVSAEAEDVLVETNDAIMIITINRPTVRNALNKSVTSGLERAFSRLDETADARAGILTGAGSYFSAGLDLAGFADGEKFSIDVVRDARPRKPLIAAIEGFAFA